MCFSLVDRRIQTIAAPQSPVLMAVCDAVDRADGGEGTVSVAKARGSARRDSEKSLPRPIPIGSSASLKKMGAENHSRDAAA